MKFGGDILVRPRMADVEGQRRLAQRALSHIDPGSDAAYRVASVGACQEACREELSALGSDSNDGLIGLDRISLIVEPNEIGNLGGTIFQRGHQFAVCDIIAEFL